MTTKKPAAKATQKPSRDSAAARSSALTLLNAGDGSPNWNEFVAAHEGLRLVALILAQGDHHEELAQFEKIWASLTEPQRAETAYFLAFGCASMARNGADDPRVPLRNLGSYWLLPSELYQDSRTSRQHASESLTGTDN